jgi:hypothetical protein
MPNMPNEQRRLAPILPPYHLLVCEFAFPISSRRLLAESQSFDDPTVTIHIGAAQISQMTSALPDHLQQPTARTLIMLVCLEVPNQLIDTRRKQSNLNFGRACIGGMDMVLFDNLYLFSL